MVEPHKTLFETIISVLSELNQEELIQLRGMIDFLLEGSDEVKPPDDQLFEEQLME